MEAICLPTNNVQPEIISNPLLSPSTLPSSSSLASISSLSWPFQLATSHPSPLSVIFFNDAIVNYLTLHEKRVLRSTCKYASQQISHYCPRIQRCHDIVELNKYGISYHVFRMWREWNTFRPVLIMSIIPWAFLLFAVLIAPLRLFFKIFSRDIEYKGIMLEMVVIAASSINEMIRVPVLAGELPKGSIYQYISQSLIIDINEYRGGPYTGKNLYSNILWLPVGIFYFILLLAVSIYHFATIIGIPNGVAQLQLALYLLWPFGYSYYYCGKLDARYIPTKIQLTTSLRAFLLANNVEIVMDDGEPIPPTPQKWSYVARHTKYYRDVHNIYEIPKDQI